ncbi:DUF106 domain-containing protein [Candidatus Bathyarchaeota archaeon]|nr:DUF106 domain-containing protein [Candidatus Bathyarchaeota archaeon]
MESTIIFRLISQNISFMQEPPMSAVVILLISIAISITTTMANRMVVKMDEYKKFTIESAYLRQELMAAIRSGNQRQIAKIQKQQQDMMKIQQKMTLDRMKIMLFFFIPFILIWQILGNFFVGTIAYLPFDAPWIGRELSVGSWYIMCSISTNVIISRALGLTFEIEPRKIEVKKS